MSEGFKATPRNSSVGYLADILFSGRDFANKARVPEAIPLLGGIGLGDMFIGKTPELLDDISYDGPKRLLRYPDAPGLLAKTQLDKRVADAAFLGADVGALGTFATRAAMKKAMKGLEGSTLNQARREFLRGRVEGQASAVPKTELESEVSRALDVPMDRRTFNKAAAITGAAGAVGAGSLLRKFGKETAEVVPKVADNASLAAVKKYKYNSLKEYLDDVETSVYSKYDEPWFDEVNDLTARQQIQHRLLQDEKMYQISKKGHGQIINENASFHSPRLRHDFRPIKAEDGSSHLYDNVSGKIIDPNDYKNAFSPQAKKEMKEYKDFVNQYRPSENGQGWARPDDIQDWLAGERIPF